LPTAAAQSNNPRVDDLAGLLAQMKRHGELPLETAVTLPREAYRSPGLYSLEIERIFRREWICAGRVDEIPALGDWFCFDLVGEPIIVVRDESHTVRAFSNVCAHRAVELKAGRGHSSTLQCPYHAWTFDLGGCLRSAPHMEKAEGFRPEAICLVEFRLEVWLGFIFVNLDRDARPLAPRLSALEARLRAYPVADATTVVHEEETWNANWKIVLENAMESYHIFRVHSKTINPVLSTKTVECLPGEPAFNLHMLRSRLVARPEAAVVWQAAIYPSLVIYIGPLEQPRVAWLTALPTDIGQSRVTTGQATVEPPPTGSEALQAVQARIKAANDAVNSEDRPICESVQRGIGSSGARRGRLSHLEAPLWEFSQYLARQLAGSG
jgi:phenylpropionate dioxygenase-like ring-hydroxylating dioxygenase large terminal subunit